MIKNLDTLKGMIDIVDVVSNYVELKKAGANFKAPCPFHDEKSASFVVSPRKQIAHCFGCGWSGDAIKFVGDFKKLDFTEAVEVIAADMNFTLIYEAQAKKNNFAKTLEAVNDFYKSNLTKVPFDYLVDRGLTYETIKEFELGYAVESHKQIEHFKANMFNFAELNTTGVVAQDEAQKTYARLSNRITFPIRTHTKKLIGFGGRIIEGDRAKYINSPQTPLFDKSRVLYGYMQAKESIYDTGTFTIVEGYLDVIMLHQAGIKTAVATMGTALTREHALQIKKVQGARALLCFDGDKAGQEAALKGAKLLSAEGIFGGVVLFPEGKDPAELIKEDRVEELYAIMKKPKPFVRFVLDTIAKAHNLSDPRQKQQALNETLAYMHTLTPFLQSEYQNYAAQRLGVQKHFIHMPKQDALKQDEHKKSGINVFELNIIATARESAAALDVVLDTVDANAFVYHAQEFNMLMHKDPALDALLLREEISVYTLDELYKQCKLLKINEHLKQLDATMQSDKYDFERKAFEIKKIKGQIAQLKKEIRL